jgi:hypothetical protein
VRPVEEVASADRRDAKQAADDRDRERLGEVAQQVEPALWEQLARQLGTRPAQRLDRPRREGRRDKLPDSRVLRRLEPEQAPALRVPERLPTRIERLGCVELVLTADVAEVAAEPSSAQARPYLRVPRDEPPLEPLLVEEGRLLAQGGKLRIRIR